MRTRSRLFIVALSAIAVLGVAVGTASANRLENSASAGGFKIVWSALKFEGSGFSVTCPVTLEGNFSAQTIVKRAGTTMGSVTGAALNAAGCTGGSATVLTETLPWTVAYNSYSGTLPTITRVTQNMIGASFRIHPSGGPECLARTETAEPARGIATVSGTEARELEADPTAEIGTTGGFLCTFSSKGHFSGTGTLTQRNGTGHPQVRLI